MSKELVIVVGIPYSGRTSWLSKKYSEEGTVVIEETSFENFTKDGKYQESEFVNSLEWVTSQVSIQMENSIQRIVVSLFQCRADHWIPLLELAITYGYTFTPVKPSNGFLFYSNKFSRTQEQFDWVEKATLKRFGKSKDKKVNEEQEDVKENPNLYQYIVVECQSAYAFILQNKKLGSEADNWLQLIQTQYKPVMLRIEQAKHAKEVRILREAEKAAKEAARQSEKVVKEAARQARSEAAIQAVIQASRQAQAQAEAEVQAEVQAEAQAESEVRVEVPNL